MDSNITQKIKSGLAVLLFARMVGITCAFLFNAVLARVISQGEMGHYFLVLNLVTFLAIFARTGSENVALKIVADALSRKNYSILKVICFNLAVLFFFSATIAGIICWFGLGWLFENFFDAYQLVLLIPLICGWMAGLGAQLILGQILRAFKEFWACSLFGGSFSHLFNFVAVGVSILCGYSLTLELVIKIIFVNLTVVNLVAFFWVGRAINSFQSETCKETTIPKAPDVKALFCMSVPLFISQIALFVSSQSDIWLLSAYLAPEQVALYGAAAKLVLLTGVSLAIANGVLPPFISDFRNRGDTQGLQKILRKVASLSAIPAIVILLFFMLVPERVLLLVFGASYVEAANILRILSVGQLVNVSVGSCGYVLVMYGFNREVMCSTFFWGVVMVLGAFCLLEWGRGATSVAILCATVIAFQQLTFLFMAYKKCSVFTAIKLKRSVI